MALKLVLVASTISSPDFHRALVMVTRSVAGGVPGVTVIVVVRVSANHDAVIVTVRVEVTAEVLTGNAPLDAPPLISVSVGTCTTAESLVDSWTFAPSVAAVNRTVPV